MNTYNFGDISGGRHQFGNQNTNINVSGQGRVEINQDGASAEAVARLAAELVQQLRSERPGLVGHAELVQGEIVTAQEEGRAIEEGRVRRWLETIQAGVGASGGALALAQALGGALGL
ncbi:hypothetical protein ACWF94_29755 [Streptomyces sp. NPDC055078]